ncbi:hypothetical protein H9P43_000379 [Blastocladiella emersonii ATCC 22665]|nr:hypothetical protein H9P43_000379 [Blastocladiella emersonii ATCC 22665]
MATTTATAVADTFFTRFLRLQRHPAVLALTLATGCALTMSPAYTRMNIERELQDLAATHHTRIHASAVSLLARLEAHQAAAAARREEQLAAGRLSADEYRALVDADRTTHADARRQLDALEDEGHQAFLEWAEQRRAMYAKPVLKQACPASRVDAAHAVTNHALAEMYGAADDAAHKRRMRDLALVSMARWQVPADGAE